MGNVCFLDICSIVVDIYLQSLFFVHYSSVIYLDSSVMGQPLANVHSFLYIVTYCAWDADSFISLLSYDILKFQIIPAQFSSPPRLKILLLKSWRQNFVALSYVVKFRQLTSNLCHLGWQLSCLIALTSIAMLGSNLNEDCVCTFGGVHRVRITWKGSSQEVGQVWMVAPK